ncbi:MAG: hypothetical protein JNJ80_19565 [Gemmatimonadetes bacterium]|nr:hypothetical protein [Gemmatimonadota bacterium]MCC7131583.1 hypothetical protein [Gemmatimonadales bacterium]
MAVAALRTTPSQTDPAALRRLLVERFPDAVLLPDRATPPVATGLIEFDRIFPQGGLPRGRLVAWPTQVGATAVLRAVCHGLLRRGERTAWVDGRRALGTEWIDGPLVIRPRDESLALKSAEILLRSGGFSLIVLTGVEPDQAALLRLSRMVHEGQGAFLAVTQRTLTASIRLSSRFLLDRFRWAVGPFGEVAAVETVALEIAATAPGWSRSATLTLPASSHDLRHALDPDLADRRGALD